LIRIFPAKKEKILKVKRKSAPYFLSQMDHTAQVIFQVLMTRMPEFAAAVSQEVAVVLHQDRLAKFSYQQALQQAGSMFVQSLFRHDLTEETAFTPIIVPLPEDETDTIRIQNFGFSKRHFATNVQRYAGDVERFYLETYKDLNVSAVVIMITNEGLSIALKKDEAAQ
jgi:hypothetical protein